MKQKTRDGILKEKSDGQAKVLGFLYGSTIGRLLLKPLVAPWVSKTAGALLSTIGWQVFSNAYSVYVEKFATYTDIYGSVYALALSMLWLFCCVSILFYGGVLNYWLKKK